MKDMESAHKKVQDLIDCFASNDPLKEMSELPKDTDTDEAALKWLAFAALHGVSANASKIRVKRDADGGVTVKATYRDGQLPSPGSEIGEKIIAAVKEIAHIEGRKGKTTLALGLRESSVDLKVKLKSEKGIDKVTLKFPE
jgi:hypothetical protein